MAVRKIVKWVVIPIGMIMLLLVYINTNFFIKNQEWKHRDGGSVGDWIEFDNVYYSLKGNSIFKNEIPAGKVVFCWGKHLIIEELSSGERGIYVNKLGFIF